MAYLGYTLQMKRSFRGWPVMVNDMHTRRRRRRLWKKFPNIQMQLWFVDYECMASQSCAWELEEIIKRNVIKTLEHLKNLIKSPRNLLVSRVLKPNFCNRSLYDKLLSLVISLVALRCTFSSRSISFFGRPLGPGLCHRKSVRPSVRPSVTLVDCGQTA